MKDLKDLFEAFAKAYGLPEWLTNDVTFIILFFSFSISIIAGIYKAIIKIISLYNNRNSYLDTDFAPYFSKTDIDRATKYYIPTKYQIISPSEDDEPGQKYIAVPKEEVIPLFINKIFTEKIRNNKYFLVLADAGMGKTTLLINLLIKYKYRLRLPWAKKLYNIKLFPLGNPNVLAEINAVENKNNTILLLDAFDEDIDALKNYKDRFDKILNVANTFKTVIITCRTQFFPSRKEEPHETGYFTYGGDGEYKFQKMYISTFDDIDVRKYLRKRFIMIFNRRADRAKSIVEKSPNLVIRPLLLSYIEDLVDTSHDYDFAFEIYETLIKKWIERESAKHGIREKYGNEVTYQNLLLRFSEALAVHLYENRSKNRGYYIDKDEPFAPSLGLALSDIEEEYQKMTDVERRSKSLLNRDAEGRYKFSHKSIMEYFLATKAFLDYSFLQKLNFEGMDAAKAFYSEMISKALKSSNGLYWTDIGKPGLPLTSVAFSDISKIIWLSINFQSIPLNRFQHFNALRTVMFKNIEVLNYLFSYIDYKKGVDFAPNALYGKYSITYLDQKIIDEINDYMIKSEMKNLSIRLDSKSQVKIFDLSLLLTKEFMEKINMIYDNMSGVYLKGAVAKIESNSQKIVRDEIESLQELFEYMKSQGKPKIYYVVEA